MRLALNVVGFGGYLIYYGYYFFLLFFIVLNLYGLWIDANLIVMSSLIALIYIPFSTQPQRVHSGMESISRKERQMDREVEMSKFNEIQKLV